MSDLITLGVPDIPMSAADEIANAFGLGGNMQTQINSFIRNNPRAAEEAAELGMDIETYYMSQILGFDVGQSGTTASGDSIQQNFVAPANSAQQNVPASRGPINKNALKNVGNQFLKSTKGIRGAAGNVLGTLGTGAAYGAMANALGPIPAMILGGTEFGQDAFRRGRNFLSNVFMFPGERSTARQEYYQSLGLDPFEVPQSDITDSGSALNNTILNSEFNFDEFVNNDFGTSEDGANNEYVAPSMDSAAAGGFLRDDPTGDGTFMGGANTLMPDDETINYNTGTGTGTDNTEGTGGTGTSGLSAKTEEYYKILREQGPEAASIYAQNLDAFVEGVSPILFGTGRDYSEEQLRSLGRTVGISYDDDRVPTLQEITSAGAKLDPTESRRIEDILLGSQVASNRQFDPAVAQAAIDFNQLMYGRREPFIKASIAASDIAPGIRFGGGIAGTMEGALPSFADQIKLDLADQQMGFNQQLLEAQKDAGKMNTAAMATQALFGPSGAYNQNLFNLQGLVDTTFQNLGLGGLLNQNQRKNRFSTIGENNSDLLDYDKMMRYYLTGE